MLRQYAHHPAVIILLIQPNRCFLDPEKQHCPFRFLSVPSFLLSFREMFGPVPRFMYFSSLTFTYRALAPTRAKSSHPQPRMLQRRRWWQQRLHLQTGSLKSLLPTRVRSTPRDYVTNIFTHRQFNLLTVIHFPRISSLLAHIIKPFRSIVSGIIRFDIS